ncbi:hypothetical protein [Spirosoma areae]
MNTTLVPLLLAFSLSSAAFLTKDTQPGRRDHPTKLARYQIGTYVSKGGKLNINVNKQLGGPVYVQLTDQMGALYFNRTMSAQDSTARFRLDIDELEEGDYVLKVSNGLEIELREIKITTSKPTKVTRSITAL